MVSRAKVVGCVEDSDLDFELMLRGVEQHRPAVGLARASRIAEAPALLRRAELHGIVVDLNLPDGCGIDLVRSLRNRGVGDSLRIVVFSTSASAADHAAALRSGADAVFVKPTRAEDFLEAALQAIDAASEGGAG